jgi:hypothetical protein
MAKSEIWFLGFILSKQVGVLDPAHLWSQLAILIYHYFIPPSIYPKIKCQNKGEFDPKCLDSCLYQIRSHVLTLTKNF